MAVLIVEEVTEVRDVVELITYLAGALASGNTDGLLGDGTFTLTRLASPTPDQLHSLVRLDEDETCTNPLHRPGCSCIEDAANTDPRQLVGRRGGRRDRRRESGREGGKGCRRCC